MSTPWDLPTWYDNLNVNVQLNVPKKEDSSEHVTELLSIHSDMLDKLRNEYYLNTMTNEEISYIAKVALSAATEIERLQRKQLSTQ